MGPSFIGADIWFELAAWNQPFNEKKHCLSWANKSGYQIPVEGGKNMLTNLKGIEFKISELEVWEVKYLDK